MKRQQITTEQLEIVYNNAKPYLDGNINRLAAIDLAVRESGMKEASVIACFDVLRKMIDGEGYRWVTSLAGYKCWVSNLVTDYPEKFDNIMSAISQHFEYLAQFGNNSKGNREYIRQFKEKHTKM